MTPVAAITLAEQLLRLAYAAKGGGSETVDLTSLNRVEAHQAVEELRAAIQRIEEGG